MFEFIQWCFRSEDSTLLTLIILSGVGAFVVSAIKAFRGKE